MLNCKRETSIEELCEGCPIPFKKFMAHVRSLTFEQKPNYKYLRGQFEGLFREYEYAEDGHFDWILHK